MDKLELINCAKEAMKNSYSPYSKFAVGSALLAKSGKIYLGCNIENASYGASNCAERTAIFKAVSEGEKEFERIAIVSSSNDYTYPCGICRQVLSEFMPEGEVILYNEKDIKTIKVKDLLPHAFSLEV